ncbi:MAG: hypothetical protein P8J25_02540 [Porticoccaceae bacterium]|nr:hypothetical protein [Porticoccaceae bacterium]
MFLRVKVKNTLNLKVLALLLLIIPSYALSDQQSESVNDATEHKIDVETLGYKASLKGVFGDNKVPVAHKHRRDKKWSEHVKEARSYFRMRLREFFSYLRRIRVALKDPETDWDNFDWSYPGTNDSTDDDSTDDDSTDDDSTDDDSTDDDSTDDDSTDDDSTDDDSTDDDSTDDDSTGDDSTDDDSTGDDSNNDNNLPIQKVSVSNQPTGLLGENVQLDVGYVASDLNNQLSGLGLRVHFDSSILSFNSVSDVLQQDIIVNGEGPVNDVEDFDNNPQTDRFITFGWASLFNNWPNTALPSLLSKITFGVSTLVDLELVASTDINFTGITTAAGYQFESENYTLELADSESTWDFDGNGDADALTDGLIMLRHSFGLRGESMVNNAMAPNSLMTVSQVEERMSGAAKIADVDNDGDVDALTDGLLLLRHLFAVDDESLTHGAVGLKASRKTNAAIKEHLNKHMPKKR